MDIAISPKLLTDFRIGYYRYNVIDTKYDQGVEFANTIGIPGHQHGRQLYVRCAWMADQWSRRATMRSLAAGLNINRCNCPLTEKERPVPGRQ